MSDAAAQVQAWLDAYVEAWRTYDPEAIGALFSAGATYAYADGQAFSNLFVLRFDADGRCSELVEYYVEHPAR